MIQRVITILGNPILRKICSPVEYTDEVPQLLDDMAEILRATPKGAALAAPQIGLSKRLVVIAKGDQTIELVNPEIIKKQGQQKGVESCLSLPGVVGKVTRARYVTVKALNRTGAEITIEAKGFLARCLQHEIDHLDGILFIDHVLPGQLYDEVTKKPLAIAPLIEVSNPHTHE